MHAHACTYVCNGCCSLLIVLIAALMQVFIPVSAQLKALACHEELACERCLQHQYSRVALNMKIRSDSSCGIMKPLKCGVYGASQTVPKIAVLGPLPT